MHTVWFLVRRWRSHSANYCRGVSVGVGVVNSSRLKFSWAHISKEGWVLGLRYGVCCLLGQLALILMPWLSLQLSVVRLRGCFLRLKFFTSPYCFLAQGGMALILGLLVTYGISFHVCTLASIWASIKLTVAGLGKLFSSCFNAVCQILQELW